MQPFTWRRDSGPHARSPMRGMSLLSLWGCLFFPYNEQTAISPEARTGAHETYHPLHGRALLHAAAGRRLRNPSVCLELAVCMPSTGRDPNRELRRRIAAFAAKSQHGRYISASLLPWSGRMPTVDAHSGQGTSRKAAPRLSDTLSPSLNHTQLSCRVSAVMHASASLACPRQACPQAASDRTCLVIRHINPFEPGMVRYWCQDKSVLRVIS